MSTHSPARSESAFTLSETLISIAVTLISLVAFFAATGQAIRIVRSGKEIAAASQMLQQRIETFRYAPPWTNATTPEGISNLIKTAAATASTFQDATETFTVTPYPAGGPPLVVTRSSKGVISSTGPSMSGEKCVQFTASVSWTGLGGSPRSRQVSTIMTKGGL